MSGWFLQACAYDLGQIQRIIADGIEDKVLELVDYMEEVLAQRSHCCDVLFGFCQLGSVWVMDDVEQDLAMTAEAGGMAGGSKLNALGSRITACRAVDGSENDGLELNCRHTPLTRQYAMFRHEMRQGSVYSSNATNVLLGCFPVPHPPPPKLDCGGAYVARSMPCKEKSNRKQQFISTDISSSL